MENKIRVAVLVSGGGTNLQALLNAQKKGALPSANVALVVSNNPGAYALKRAERSGVETKILNKKQLGDAFEAQLIATLEEKRIDLIVLAGFMCILSKAFTDRYPQRILNVHPSLIPAFCGEGFYGLRVHQAALEKGVKVTGATVHFVNEIPDGGRILLQKAVAIRDDDTPQTLQKRVMRLAEWRLLPQAVEQVAHELLQH